MFILSLKSEKLECLTLFVLRRIFKSSYAFLILKHSSAIKFLMMLKNTVGLVDYKSLGRFFNNCIQSSSLDTSKIYGTLNICATRVEGAGY